MSIDLRLQNYREQLQQNLEMQHGKDCIPNFCSEYSSDLSEKRVLAVLQDPGKSGAERSRECSIYNHDQTSRNQWRIIIDDLEFDPTEILFWNFYPYYDFSRRKFKWGEKKQDKIACAKELKKLADLMENLEVMVICGNESKLGMKYYNPTCQIPKIYVPHPSHRGLLQGRESNFRDGWEKAKEILTDNDKQPVKSNLESTPPFLMLSCKWRIFHSNLGNPSPNCRL